MTAIPKASNQLARPGAPKSNGNAIRHGLKAGRLPKDARYIEYRMNAFRRELESAVIDCKSEVSLTDAALIQTAMRWERHAELCQRWLTKKQNELKPEQLMQFSRDIARASAERDKAITALGLNVKKQFWLEETSNESEPEA